MSREVPREKVSMACLTMIVGIPLALAIIIWGGQGLIWLLEKLPQN